jgi:hypothetical protein
MSLAMKAFFTAVIVALVGAFSLWSGSPVRADHVWIMLAIAAGMIAVIWTFPKAGF